MPLIEGRVGNFPKETTEKLALAITRATVEALAIGFAGQLGYVGGEVEKVAGEVIRGIAPNWVWVNIEPFQPYIAGMPPGTGPGGRFDIVLLENALDGKYLDAITEAVARAARGILATTSSPVPLAVTLVTGHVDMS